MGSQLIINNPKTNYTPTPQPFSSSSGGAIIMGSSQMLVPSNSGNEGNYEDRDAIFPNEDFGSQVMYEYVGDGRDNAAFDDDT